VGSPALQHVSRAGGSTAPGSPEQMRSAMASYVEALHIAYLDIARLLPPAERTRLPLLTAGPLTVVAAAARHLHVIATTDRLPAPSGPEVELDGELPDLRWTLRFLDPVVLPELGLLDESISPKAADVRRVIGIGNIVYHLSVAPGGGLTAHHASHAGTGLANQHAAAHRDFDALRHLAKGRELLIDEMAVASQLSLHNAVRALALLVSPHEPQLAADCSDPMADDVKIRRSLLATFAPGSAA
jgi:hypothetical protein